MREPAEVRPRRQPGAETADQEQDFTTGAHRFRRVFLESPYAGAVEENLAYARACVADCLARGEAAFGSHLLYTQPGIRNDDDPAERAAGIAAGQAFLGCRELSVVYVDRGVSIGMLLGIVAAHRLGVPVEYRRLGVAG